MRIRPAALDVNGAVGVFLFGGRDVAALEGSPVMLTREEAANSDIADCLKDSPTTEVVCLREAYPELWQIKFGRKP